MCSGLELLFSSLLPFNILWSWISLSKQLETHHHFDISQLTLYISYALSWVLFEYSLLPFEHSKDNPEHAKHAANTSMWSSGQTPLHCMWVRLRLFCSRKSSPKTSFHSVQTYTSKDEMSSPYIIYPPQQCLFELYQAAVGRVFYFNELLIHAWILTENHSIESHAFLLFV